MTTKTFTDQEKVEILGDVQESLQNLLETVLGIYEKMLTNKNWRKSDSFKTIEDKVDKLVLEIETQIFEVKKTRNQLGDI